MKPEIKKRFIKRLKTTTKPQIIGELKHKNGRCALGILCDLAVEDGVAVWNEDYIVDKNDNEFDVGLPKGIIKWAGVKTGAVKVIYDSGKRSIIYLNDVLNMPFKKIAKKIESGEIEIL